MRELMPTAGAEYANSVLDLPGVFDNRARFRRIVQGVATTKHRNNNGHIFDPTGATCELPGLLLWNHDWRTPVGRVTAIKATPEGLFFEARIIDGVLSWAELCWWHLQTGAIPAVSVRGKSLPPYKDNRWVCFEISLCEQGACANATVHVVKSVLSPGIVSLDDRPRDVIHRDIRRSVPAGDKCVTTPSRSIRASM